MSTTVAKGTVLIGTSDNSHSVQMHQYGLNRGLKLSSQRRDASLEIKIIVRNII